MTHPPNKNQQPHDLGQPELQAKARALLRFFDAVKTNPKLPIEIKRQLNTIDRSLMTSREQED